MLLVKIKESYLDTVDQGVRNPKALTPLDQNLILKISEEHISQAQLQSRLCGCVFS